MNKIVIFVGFVNFFYLDYFYTKGFTIGVFKENAIENFYEQSSDISDEDILSKIDFIIPFDYSNRKSLEQSFRSYYFKEDTLLICRYDRYIYATTIISEILNLKQAKNFPSEKAKISTNKILQRDLLAKNNPEITVNYRKVKTFHQAYLFYRKHDFPLIVKPANLSGSRLVNYCNNLDELISKVSYILDHVKEVYETNGIRREPQVLIEEFIDGKVYSVDSYVDQSGKITHTPPCREFTGYELGYQNFNLPYSGYFNDTTEKENQNIYKTVEKAIKAFGIVSNTFHIEVKINSEDTCKIIEINVRTGGERDKLLFQSYGINHVENYLNTLLNKPIEINPKLKKYSGYVKTWPQKNGILKKINGIAECQKLESFVSINFKKEIGSMVGRSDDGHGMAAAFIIANESKETLDQDFKKIHELIQFEVQEVPNKEES